MPPESYQQLVARLDMQSQMIRTLRESNKLLSALPARVERLETEMANIIQQLDALGRAAETFKDGPVNG